MSTTRSERSDHQEPLGLPRPSLGSCRPLLIKSLLRAALGFGLLCGGLAGQERPSGPATSGSKDVPRRPAPAPPARAHGPSPRRISGLGQPDPYSDQALVQAAMRDLARGQVVVVEDTFPLWPDWSQARGGHFRWFGPRQALGLAPAPWMDTSKVISGGNTIDQLYPLGWGY